MTFLVHQYARVAFVVRAEPVASTEVRWFEGRPCGDRPAE